MTGYEHGAILTSATKFGCCYRKPHRDARVAQSVRRLYSAQAMVLESQSQALRRAPC